MKLEYINIQGDQIRKVQCEKKVYLNMCVILNCLWDRYVWLFRLNSVRVCLLDEGRRLWKTDTLDVLFARILDAAARITRYEEQFRQKKKVYSHMSCKVNWGCRWNLRTVIVNCYKIFHLSRKLKLKKIIAITIFFDR